MSRVGTAVVWLTPGGIVEFVADLGVAVTIIDFQNLAAGDYAPSLGEEEMRLLQKYAPGLLDDLAPYQPALRCEMCDQGYRMEDELNPFSDPALLVEPGEEPPVGACPVCAGPVYRVPKAKVSGVIAIDGDELS